MKKTANADAAERTLTMCSLIDKTIEEVRNMAIRLRPGVLDDLGLVDALEWHTTDFELTSGISSVSQLLNGFVLSARSLFHQDSPRKDDGLNP